MNSRLEKMFVVFFTPAMHVNYVARFDFFSNMNYGLISELEQTYDIRLTNDICVCIIINTPGRTLYHKESYIVTLNIFYIL